MYSGSMVGAGPTVFALMPYAVTHCNADGFVEINPKLVSHIFGVTVDDINKALDYLCAPDPDSRTDAEEGRRLAHEGAFLYRIVNHAKYRDLQRAEDERKAVRERVRRHREKKRPVTACNGSVTGMKRHTETETETEDISSNEDIRPERSPKRTARPYRIGFDRQTNTFTGMTPEDITTWSDAFPGVEVEIELRRAAIWLRDNPAKRKKNVQGFLSRWLGRCQEHGGNRGQPPPQATARDAIEQFRRRQEKTQ